ncbi:PPE domain-containing protein [Pseudonocardia saturnea]
MTVPRDWRELTHEELYAAVQSGPGAGASMAAEAMWRRLAEIIAAAESRMRAAVTRSADGWQGEGADAARGGLGALNSWALDAATDARTTLSTILDQGVSAGRLRALMPPPPTEQLAVARADVEAHPGDSNREWELYDLQQQAAARDEDARRKMEQYHWLSAENRSTIDFWSTPPTVLVEVASAPPVAGAGVPGFGAAGPGSPSVVGPAGGPDVPGGGPTASGAQAAGGLPGGSAGPPVAGAGSAGAGVNGVGVNGAGLNGPGQNGAGAYGAGPVGLGSVGSPVTPGGPGPLPAYGGPSAVAPATGAGVRGAVPPTGRDALPPGAGGRGPRTPSGVDPRATPAPPGRPGSDGGAGFRPVVPGTRPLTSPSPTWRDLVSGQRGPNGGFPGAPADQVPGNRTGGGGPGGPGTTPRPGLPAVTETATRTGTGIAGSHGMYPPMGAPGSQGEGRRRPTYLVDDSGAFDVDVPCTEPVIGESDPGADRLPGRRP